MSLFDGIEIIRLKEDAIYYTLTAIGTGLTTIRNMMVMMMMLPFVVWFVGCNKAQLMKKVLMVLILVEF